MLARVPDDPLSLITQWSRDIERALNGSEGAKARGEITAAAWAPAVDIKEDDGAYVLHADLPGVSPNDIELNMENGRLTLRGERKLENREQQGPYRHIERVSGTFYRQFVLPDTADAEHISAKCANGVLEVRIPKQKRLRPRRIMVD
jgi:HSP20 family protein